MGSLDECEIVNVEEEQYISDMMEEIVISSDEEAVECDADGDSNSQNHSASELKISSVVSCQELDFRENVEQLFPIESTTENEINPVLTEAESTNHVAPAVSTNRGNQSDDDSSEMNFSYDSLTEGEDVENASFAHSANLARQRRSMLNKLYQSLWQSISSEASKPKSKIDLLKISVDMIKKLTIEGRKLEYTAELCLQSNYRLKRRVKRLTKKKRKQGELVEDPGPGKVVTSRASV